MVRTFISKNLRGKWTLQAMRDAVAAVANGGHLRTVAKQFKVPRNTLRRHVFKQNSGQEVVKEIGKRTVLSFCVRHLQVAIEPASVVSVV
jgi:transposase-like protein